MRSAEDGARLVAAYQESGLTQKGFALREGIKQCTLSYWVKKLSSSEPSTSRGFVRVVKTDQTSKSPVRIIVSEKITLHFESLPDPRFIAQLARALGC